MRRESAQAVLARRVSAASRVMVLGLAAWLALPAQAEDKACLFEGFYPIGNGQEQPIKDCLENAGTAEEDFKRTCETVLAVGAEHAKVVGDRPPKFSYQPQCPAEPAYKCLGFFRQPINSYYYARPDDAIVRARDSCIAQNGVWQEPVATAAQPAASAASPVAKGKKKTGTKR
jgi:hypothetical protein